MINRTILKSLVVRKLKASKALYTAGDYDTAGYILGYVVECGLKAIICKTLNLREYPDTGRHFNVFASHSLDLLLILSGYSCELDITRKSNKHLKNNWQKLTKDWSPDVRYKQGVYSQDLIKEKLVAIEDSKYGFLAWFQGKW